MFDKITAALYIAGVLAFIYILSLFYYLPGIKSTFEIYSELTFDPAYLVYFLLPADFYDINIVLGQLKNEFVICTSNYYGSVYITFALAIIYFYFTFNDPETLSTTIFLALSNAEFLG